MDEPSSAARPLYIPTQTTAAAVRTADQLIVGLLHARPQKRLKDELNANTERYVAITAARVYDAAGSRLLYESTVVLLANDHIVSVTPLAAVRGGEAAWSQLLATAPAERH
jgi:hypothetical protein